MIDWDTTAAWIALAVAIITPFASALISNCYSYKKHKAEIQLRRDIEITKVKDTMIVDAITDFCECGTFMVSNPMPPIEISGRYYRARTILLMLVNDDALSLSLQEYRPYSDNGMESFAQLTQLCLKLGAHFSLHNK